MVIDVLELIGEDCITVEDGEKIYEIILTSLKSSTKVTINFAGVNVFASPFFNAAIGRLLKDFSRDKLNELLVFSKISNEGLSLLKLVIKNSAQYYSDEKYRKAHDEVIAEQAGEQ